MISRSSSNFNTKPNNKIKKKISRFKSPIRKILSIPGWRGGRGVFLPSANFELIFLSRRSGKVFSITNFLINKIVGKFFIVETTHNPFPPPKFGKLEFRVVFINLGVG